jgi:hypothetical protein
MAVFVSPGFGSKYTYFTYGTCTGNRYFRTHTFPQYSSMGVCIQFLGREHLLLSLNNTHTIQL